VDVMVTSWLMTSSVWCRVSDEETTMLTKIEVQDVDTRVRPTSAATVAEVVETKVGTSPARLRSAAIAVGAFYLAGDAVGGVSAFLGTRLFKEPGYLGRIDAHQNQLAIGALCVLAMGFFLAAISFVMYPIFRKTNEMVAIGYLVFRGALETVVYLAQANNWLLFGDLSRDYVAAGSTDSPEFVSLGRQLKSQISITAHMTEIVFSLGALLFAYLFYQSRLIPRWLSVWGFAGGLFYLAVPLLSLFDVSAGWLEAPLGVQEIALAVWLLVKGFDSPVPESSGPMTGR
jgi:Domain of unknown function (DUF4386)